MSLWNLLELNCNKKTVNFRLLTLALFRPYVPPLGHQSESVSAVGHDPGKFVLDDGRFQCLVIEVSQVLRDLENPEADVVRRVALNIPAKRDAYGKSRSIHDYCAYEILVQPEHNGLSPKQCESLNQLWNREEVTLIVLSIHSAYFYSKSLKIALYGKNIFCSLEFL